MDTKDSEQDIIEKLKIQMLSPPKNGIEDHPIILIRHSFSQYNLAQDMYAYETKKDETDPEAKKFRLNKVHVDSPLHPIGIKQASNHQVYINQINFHTVFVSPLKRTLQTCQQLFQTHPNVQNINFVILPLLSEFFFNACALCCNPDKNVEEFQNKFGMKFDCVELNKIKGNYFWQIEDLELEQEKKKELLERCKNTKNQEEFIDLIIKEFEIIFPNNFESRDMLWQRTRKIRQYVSCYMSNTKLSKDQKIGIISHRSVLWFTGSSERDESGKVNGPFMGNCELVPCTNL